MPTLRQQSLLDLVGPTLLPQTAGDIEEGRIRRSLDLAKLYQLQREPGFQQQQLNLARSGLDETTQYHIGQLLSEGRGQDISLRGQDLAAKSSAETNRAGVFGDLLRNAATANVPIDIQADASRDEGYGGALANLLGNAATQKRDTAAQALFKQYSSYKPGKEREAFLSSLDPDSHAALASLITTQASNVANAVPANTSTSTIAPTPGSIFQPEAPSISYGIGGAVERQPQINQERLSKILQLLGNILPTEI